MSLPEELLIHINKHKFLLKKFLKTSREMLSLDLEDDLELLDQILKVRSDQQEKLMTVFQKINELKNGIPKEEFLDKIKTNDSIIEEILKLDTEVQQKLKAKQQIIGDNLKSLVSNKQAIGKYKQIKINLPKLLDKV